MCGGAVFSIPGPAATALPVSMPRKAEKLPTPVLTSHIQTQTKHEYQRRYNIFGEMYRVITVSHGFWGCGKILKCAIPAELLQKIVNFHIYFEMKTSKKR